MMRRFAHIGLVSLLTLLALGFAPAATRAQDDEAIWYYAINPSSGEVIGYSYAGDGAITVEITSAVGEGANLVNARRIDSQSIIVWAAWLLEGTFELFRIGPDGAMPVTMPEGADNVLPRPPAAHSHPYYVFQISLNDDMSGDLVEMAIVNIYTLNVEYVPGIQDRLSPPRFSSDGTRLRYATYDDNVGAWMLYERSIQMGETRTIGALPGSPTSLRATPDRFGDRWVYPLSDSVDGLTRYNALIMDGTENEWLTLEEPYSIVMIREEAAIRDVDCTIVCQLELRPFSGGDSTFYPLPDGDDEIELRTTVVDNQVIIRTVNDETLWLLTPDTEPAELGNWNFTNGPFEEHLSPDGRWLVTWRDDANSIQVWDLAQREVVTRQFYDRPTLLGNFGDAGFVAIHGEDEGFAVFSVLYADGTVREWFHQTDTSINYFNVLPDGTALYHDFNWRTDPPEIGIYHYDPQTDTHTLLLESAMQVDILPLP